MLILLRKVSHASTVPPTNPSQGATSGEESDIDSSLMPKFLSVGDVDESEISSQPWASGVHPLRGESNLSTTSSVENRARNFSRNPMFAVKLNAAVNPTGNSNEITTSMRRRKRGTMDYESIALALRLTCEINRRLDFANSANSRLKPSGLAKHTIHDGDKVNPCETLYRNISTTTVASVTATPGTKIFDTEPLQRKNLTVYVNKIADILEYGPLIPTLALLLLDRASSVETIREDDMSYDNHSHNSLLTRVCPYITSRTVHKLYLAAVILANRMVRGEFLLQSHHQHYLFQDEYTEYYAELLTRGGIETIPYELGKMMECMFQSLGMDGLNFSTAEVDQLMSSWRGLFVWEGENADDK